MIKRSWSTINRHSPCKASEEWLTFWFIVTRLKLFDLVFYNSRWKVSFFNGRLKSKKMRLVRWSAPIWLFQCIWGDCTKWHSRVKKCQTRAWGIFFLKQTLAELSKPFLRLDFLSFDIACAGFGVCCQFVCRKTPCFGVS